MSEITNTVLTNTDPQELYLLLIEQKEDNQLNKELDKEFDDFIKEMKSCMVENAIFSYTMKIPDIFESHIQKFRERMNTRIVDKSPYFYNKSLEYTYSGHYFTLEILKKCDV
jgi:hypothetical protein